MDAASGGNYESCEVLLAAGANANCRDDTKEALDALLYAAAGQFSQVIALLLKNGALPTTASSTGANGIWRALGGTRDAAPTVRQLLKAGTSASMIFPRTGESLLHQAGACDQINSVLPLIHYGAEINLPDKSGRTALHMASWHANSALVNTLIENGADVHAKDLTSRSCLHNAAESMNIKYRKVSS
jgi:ankyrin repeat protein